MITATRLPQAFNERNIRERLLITAAVFAVLWGLADFFAFRPAAERSADLAAELRKTSDELARLSAAKRSSAQSEVLAAATKATKATEATRALERLEHALHREKHRVEKRFSSFIAAKELPALLKTVIEETATLAVVSLSLHEPERLKLGPSGGAGEGGEQARATPKAAAEIYRHTVSLTVRGGFFEILRYLEALSAMPWRFTWRSLTYEVDSYPFALATLEVQTLSRDRGPFGE